MLRDIKKNRIDVIIFVCVLLLSVFSILAVYSATVSSDSNYMRDNFNKQIIWILMGLLLGGIITFLPISWLSNIAYAIYILLLILLLPLAFFDLGSGSSRWLEFAGIMLQPSEFMKPVLVMVLARFLGKDYKNPNNFRVISGAFFLVFLPFVLVLKQPDLGTSLTFVICVLPILYWRGMNLFLIFVLCAPIITFISSFNFWSFFIVILLISIILYFSKRKAIIVWSVFLINIFVGILAPKVWTNLHDYQKQRVLTFLGVVSDPQGVEYQIIQSKVAIGSGGIFGKGLLQGSQTHLRFLPAQHTDFIFSVIAEEWGFIGAFILLCVFLVFFIRGVFLASISQDMTASLMTIGLVTILAFQVFVNIGMSLGIVPVTGLPLPFISYGGSSMITSMIMAGLIANTSLNRYKLY